MMKRKQGQAEAHPILSTNFLHFFLEDRPKPVRTGLGAGAVNNVT